jgi:hypothetical protein
MADIEAQQLTLIDAETVTPLFWQYSGRMQHCQWDAETTPVIDREQAKLIPLLNRGYVFLSLAIGLRPDRYTGPSMKQWIRKFFSKVNRVSKRRAMISSSATLRLAAAQINIYAGPGMVRPTRAHVHCLIALKKGADLEKRISIVQEVFTQISGCVVTSKKKGSKTVLVEDEEYLANTIEYFLGYPLKLIDGSSANESGLHPEIPWGDGLRLYAAPKPLSKCRSVRNYLPESPSSVEDNLTDPVALADSFEAFAGLHSYRCYHDTSLEAELCDSCRATETAPEAANGYSRVESAAKPSTKPKKPRDGPYNDEKVGRGGEKRDVIMRIWRTAHHEYDELQVTRVLVRKFSSRKAVEWALLSRGDEWVLENWKAEEQALARLRMARPARLF